MAETWGVTVIFYHPLPYLARGGHKKRHQMSQLYLEQCDDFLTNVLPSYATSRSIFVSSLGDSFFEDIYSSASVDIGVNVPQQPKTMKISAAFCVHRETRQPAIAPWGHWGL